MTNPLIAHEQATPLLGLTNLSTQGNADLAGTGVFYDAATTASDASQHNWTAVGIDAAGDALDLLGVVEDPFGVLLSAPIGWIIEHVGFLKDALDLVAGDPDAVRTHAETWRAVSAALTKSAEDYTRSAQALVEQSKGEAVDAYAKAAANYAKAVSGAAAHANDAAKGFEVAGAIVGTVRGVIRDTISQFAADALIKGLAALALSVETFGGSIAAWVTDSVVEATSVAARDAAKVAEAVRDVTELTRGAKSSARALESAERDLAKGTRAAGAGARSATRAAERAGERSAKLKEVGDATKDVTRAEQKLTAANAATERARQAEAAATTRLHSARTAAEREEALGAMANAHARVVAHESQAAHARTDIAQAMAARTAAQKEFRESLNHSVEPEAEKHVREGLQELGLQSKESTVQYGEAGEHGDETVESIDDGSLVEAD